VKIGHLLLGILGIRRFMDIHARHGIGGFLDKPISV